MTPPLTFWERIRWTFFGIPRRADAACFNCDHKGRVIDLGDGDFICDRCWVSWRVFPRP